MIHTILIPVDFSEADKRACKYGVGIAEGLEKARQAGALPGDPIVVEVFHCYEIPAVKGPDGSVLVDSDTETEIMEDAKKRLSAFIGSYADREVTLRTEARQGPPAETILERAKEIGANLIVMGTHGRKGLARFFLGSVAEQVLRSSTVPVLTLRPKG